MRGENLCHALRCGSANDCFQPEGRPSETYRDLFTHPRFSLGCIYRVHFHIQVILCVCMYVYVREHRMCGGLVSNLLRLLEDGYCRGTPPRGITEAGSRARRSGRGEKARMEEVEAAVARVTSPNHSYHSLKIFTVPSKSL